MESSLDTPLKEDIQYVALEANFAHPPQSIITSGYQERQVYPAEETKRLAKRLVIVNNIMFALPGWIADIVAAYWFFSVTKAYSGYSGYKPMGFPGTATFAGILNIGQLIAVPFMLYFTQTADIWQWILRTIFSQFSHCFDCYDGGNWLKPFLSSSYAMIHLTVSMIVLLLAAGLSTAGPPFDGARGISGNAPLLMLFAVMARIFIGACYMWWYQEELGGNVVRHYGYLGSLSKLYYAKCTPSDDGATLTIRDQISIMAGSATNYVGNNTVVNTTFASAESYHPDDKVTTVSSTFPVWITTWFLMILNSVPFALMIWIVSISPFGGTSRA